MKTLVPALLLATLVAPPLQAAQPTPGGCDAMLGVWEYAPPTGQGRSISTKLGDKYALVWFAWRTGQATTANPTSEAEKALLYDTVDAGAGEYTCEGSGGKLRWQFKTLHSIRPAAVGTTATADLELDGNTMRAWVIGPDGKRGPMVVATRVK